MYVKGNKKNFCWYISDKRKARDNVSPLWKETGRPAYLGYGED